MSNLTSLINVIMDDTGNIESLDDANLFHLSAMIQ